MADSRGSSPYVARPDSSGGENIHVSVRCRPLNESEGRKGAQIAIVCNESQKAVKIVNLGSSTSASSKKLTREFKFSQVFGISAKQAEVFNAVVAPAVQEAIAGFNCSVFVYGPSGSGKTHTLVSGAANLSRRTSSFADLEDATINRVRSGSSVATVVLPAMSPTAAGSGLDDQEQWGMIPRAAEQLFHYLSLQLADYTVVASFLDISKFNNTIADIPEVVKWYLSSSCICFYCYR
jgi:hypothetical protein